MRFETFKTLEEVTARIREIEKDTKDMVWNNDAGDWDIDDIEANAALYKEMGYESFVLDTVDLDVWDAEQKEILFKNDGIDW